MFTNELGENLKYIENNRFQGKSKFVTKNKNAGNVILTNEASYQNFDWKDKKMRILSLFRYWNSIEYFFPYKYQMDKNWNQVLQEMLPKFLSPQSELDYHLAMLEIIVDLDDSHAGLNTNLTIDYFGAKYIPAKFSIVDNKAVITSFYNDSLADINDLRIGDVIEKANGKTINEILQQKSEFIQGSNTSAKFAYAFNKIFNGVTDSIEIEFLRNDKIKGNEIGRYSFDQFKYKKPSTDKWKILENNIGYINLGEVEVSDVSAILEEIKNTKSIIFDLRNYPKFTLPYILNFLNPSAKELLVSIIPDLNYPGKFYWEEPMSMGENNNNPYRGKVIILVNSRTISYAELYAMGLQTVNNSITIGSQTLGADGNVSRVEFIGGFKTGFSGIGIFYPDFTETQRKGVRIDIEVKPTILGIKQGRDEVLEKAIKVALE
ncbi:S41 family peptidase [Maribacter sp. CXY002]|uniref:S41 family peptidase n=1 Tax=Maribacter luteocoastalis TaxID=3407671 RepID=UPI003B6855EA